MNKLMSIVSILVFICSCTNSTCIQDDKEQTVKDIGIQNVTITAGEANELYLGQENEIIVNVKGISSACIALSIAGGIGKLEKIEGPLFSVTPHSYDDILINFEDRCSNGIKTFTFKVKKNNPSLTR